MHTVQSWVFFYVSKEENGKTRNGYGWREWESFCVAIFHFFSSLLSSLRLPCSWCCCLCESVKAHFKATDKHLSVAAKRWTNMIVIARRGVQRCLNSRMVCHIDVCMRAYMCVCVWNAIRFKVEYIFLSIDWANILPFNITFDSP